MQIPNRMILLARVAVMTAVAMIAGPAAADVAPQLDGVDLNPWTQILADAMDLVPPDEVYDEVTYPDGSTLHNVKVWRGNRLDGLHATIAALAFVQGSQTDTLGDLNGDGVVDVSDLLIVLANWGPGEDPQMAMALIEAMRGQSSERLPPESPAQSRPLPPPPPMGIVNCNNTPSWIDGGVQWAIEESQISVDAGAELVLWNGVHAGTPGIDESIPPDQWEQMVELVPKFMAANPDVRWGMYLRVRSESFKDGDYDAVWPEIVLDQSRDGTRPIDRVIDALSKLAGGDDRLVIALDASTRGGKVTEQFAREMQARGILFIAEGHGDLKANWPVHTMASVRWGWRHFHRDGMLPPAVRSSGAWRWVWDARLPVNGKTVAELVGKTDAQLIADYAAAGFGVAGLPPALQAWKAAVSESGEADKAKGIDQ